MFFRLLAVNMDGTLLTKNGRIHRSTREAISYVQEKGVKVTLVTSRAFSSAKKTADVLGLSVPIISNQGAFVATELENPIFAQQIGTEKAIDLVRFLEGFPCHIRLIQEEHILANRHKGDRNFLGKVVFSFGDQSTQAVQYVKNLSTTLQTNQVNPLVIDVRFDHEEDLKDVVLSLKGMFSTLTAVMADEHGLRITVKDASKLSGLVRVGEYLNIPVQDMVAIGDALDDVEMIKAAGLGVAMGNAAIPVKRSADWVTRSNVEHGVAYMVKEHFRKQQRFEFLQKIKIEK